MWLRYYGIETDALGEAVDPRSLNTWLTDNSGYDSGGNLKWDKVTGYASSNAAGGAIIYDYNSPGYGSSMSELIPYINPLLTSSTPDPVIFKEDGGAHWVIGSGIVQNNGTYNLYFQRFRLVSNAVFRSNYDDTRKRLR